MNAHLVPHLGLEGPRWFNTSLAVCAVSSNIASLPCGLSSSIRLDWASSQCVVLDFQNKVESAMHFLKLLKYG